MKKIFTGLCLLFNLQVLSQTIYYVNDNASGADNGSSWTNAFTKLQDALAKAVSGNQIWVATGIYYPDEGVGFTNNDRSHSFFLKNGVAIYGGFVGTETLLSARNWKTNETTLSGEINQDEMLENNAYHVVQSTDVDKTAVLDGFTITGGNANGPFPENSGGGMYNTISSSSSPTLINCSFSNNNASYGGGMGNDIGSSPSLTNCSFSNNNALYGGGILNIISSPTLTNCNFSGNTAGGEMNVFEESPPPGGGGGMYNYESSPVLINCSFTANKTNNEGSGGGILNEYSSTPILTHCSFSGNTAEYGGGISNAYSYLILTNCSFTANKANILGSGIFNGFSSPVFTSCSFLGNSAGGGGEIFNQGSSPNFTNCILWGNINGQIVNNDNESSPVVTYSIVQGGFPGTGNLHQDPLFVDATNGDLHLQAGSPAIDAGLTSANTTTVDLEGKPRVVNGIIDMGAYEFQVTAVPVVITSVTANPSTLWPPNHKMKEVEVTTVNTGGSGSTSCQITAVSSNEPQNGGGKDDVSSDWQIISSDKVLLRAERDGKGSGRIYTITVTCTDASDRSDSRTVQVKVLHDQGNRGISSISESDRTQEVEVDAKCSLRSVPNPFSTRATISFSVPQSGYTALDVIDATGVVVERLYAAQAEGGRMYTLSLQSKLLKSGVYILRLTAGKYVQTYRLVVMQ